jgi:simple sugar transport system permease protein
MTIVSPELGEALFGDPASGEFFRSFMVYGVIGLALGLYVWKNLKATRDQNAL